MIDVQPSQFSGTKDELDARVQAFKDALIAHAFTVDVPAPLEDDWLMAIVKNNADYQLAPPPVEDNSPPVIPDWGRAIIAELASKADASDAIKQVAADNAIVVEVPVDRLGVQVMQVGA